MLIFWGDWQFSIGNVGTTCSHLKQAKKGRRVMMAAVLRNESGTICAYKFQHFWKYYFHKLMLDQ